MGAASHPRASHASGQKTPRDLLSRFLLQCAQSFEKSGHAQAKLVANLIVEAVATHIPKRPRLREIDNVFFADCLQDPAAHDLAGPLDRVHRHVVWIHRDIMPAGFTGRYRYTEIIGPDGPVVSDKLAFGAYLQWPSAFYPSHWHEAEELYFIVSGEADWRQGDGRLVRRRPGDFIHHLSNEPHEMTTLERPLLALWAWTGNLDFSTYEIVDQEK